MTSATHALDDEPIDATIGRRVHMLMWERGLSQAAVALEVGMERVLLGRKLRGSRPWYARELAPIARELKTTVSYLIGESDDPVPPWAPRDSNPQPTDLQLAQVSAGRPGVLRVIDFGDSDDYDRGPAREQRAA